MYTDYRTEARGSHEDRPSCQTQHVTRQDLAREATRHRRGLARDVRGLLPLPELVPHLVEEVL